MVTKEEPTSVILRKPPNRTTLGPYNADLGNGADGQAGDCTPQPLLFWLFLPEPLLNLPVMRRIVLSRTPVRGLRNLPPDQFDAHSFIWQDRILRPSLFGFLDDDSVRVALIELR